ncbi:MAG: ArsR/SmtB family transcription factor [Akkermansiaceae bacterium]
MKELGISRPTASKYLDILKTDGLLERRKIGRHYFFINRPLLNLIIQH